MAQTTTPQLVVNPPQYVEESTEGTTPTASPTFVACGAVKSLSLKINGNFVDIAQIGAEDLVSIIQGMQEYESQIVFTMVNSTFLKYLVNSANFGIPTGTVSATTSILFSYYLDGTVNYVIMKGSRPKSGSVTMEIGKETEVTMELVHTTISTPNSSHGLTTPTLVTAISGTVLGWTDGGANPVVHNSNAQDCKKVTVNINRNTSVDHTLGNLDPHSSQPYGRQISGEMTILHTATTLETDMKAGTARTLAITLDTGVSVLTLSNTYLTDITRDEGIDSIEAVVEVITFKALTASLT